MALPGDVAPQSPAKLTSSFQRRPPLPPRTMMAALRRAGSEKNIRQTGRRVSPNILVRGGEGGGGHCEVKFCGEMFTEGASTPAGGLAWGLFLNSAGYGGSTGGVAHFRGDVGVGPLNPRRRPRVSRGTRVWGAT